MNNSSSVLGSLCCLLFLSACAESPRPPAQPAFYRDLASAGAKPDLQSAQSILNGYRSGLGLGLLSIDPALVAQAEAEASRLAAQGAVAAPHTEPGRSTGVSAGYYTVSDAFSGWRGSKPHDSVMRRPDARRFGLATAYNGASRHKIYWVLITAP